MRLGKCVPASSLIFQGKTHLQGRKIHEFMYFNIGKRFLLVFLLFGCLFVYTNGGIRMNACSGGYLLSSELNGAGTRYV